MRVTLVVPNFRWVDSDKNALWHYLPYNLCLLASCIRDICDVSIVDAYKENMSVETLRGVLTEKKPDLVGITVLMDKYGPSGHIVARIAKELGSIVVIGGVYASMNTCNVANDRNIDYIVKGEGEYSLRHIIQNHPSCKVIEYPRNKNLDKLPLPAYDLIDFQSYANSAERKSVDSPSLLPYGHIMTSRGCPFGCCFCQVEKISGKAFRPRSPQNVLNEIKWLRDTYGVKSLIFDDDNLLTDKERARQIFQGMVDQGLAMPWKMIATAAFKLDKPLIRVMKESGCEYVNIAIESGNERILHKIINKPVDLKYAALMTSMLQEYGIYVAANFIIGFPTETWDEIRESLAFADYLDADYTKIFAAMPLRNTRLWDMCEKQDAFKKDFNGVVNWGKGQIETKDFNADDLTILRAFEWERINFSDKNKRSKTCRMMGVSEQELLQIRRDTISQSLKAITTQVSS
jgi:anaerobic magnesium-protoporphyrin IX monomethyl ester cyclase